MEEHYFTEQHQHVVMKVVRQMLLQLNDSQKNDDLSRITTAGDCNFATAHLQEFYEMLNILSGGIRTLNDDQQRLSNESLQIQVTLPALTEELSKGKLSTEESNAFLVGIKHNQDVLNQDVASLQEKINDLQYVSYDGTLVWKITNVKEKMTFIVLTVHRASEIKNLLLYGLLPIFYQHLQVDKAAHIALFVCAVRQMLHGPKLFGHKTGLLAHDLLSIYYKDHCKHYYNLENLVLHLHMHYSTQYLNYGSLNNTNCFAQESLLGAFSKNQHGTRYWGDLLIDFALQKIINQQEVDNVKRNEGAFDITRLSINNIDELLSWHKRVCDCNQTATCIIIYHRCVIKSQTYHSLSYPKRQSTNSYFVKYTNDRRNTLFGAIELFFTYKDSILALINNYPNKHLFSDVFASSSYHSSLSKYIDTYFYLL
ncbi:unnamed protein product [Rotaria sp. Silwood2]|nr:unnamed protein product [Rotaria sp. Silwood2]CAF4608845.1 unnamed protein product [Rotaria sp. Silwood2]